MIKQLLSACIVGLVLLSGSALGQVAATITPTYGCPNTTGSYIDITMTNNSGFSIPGGITYTISLVIKTDANVTLQTYTQSFNDGFANGASKTITINGIDFVGPMTCPVTGTISAVLPPPFGAQSFAVSNSYVVQYPPSLSISETPAGTLTVSTSLNGYSVNFYKDAVYTSAYYTTTSNTYAVTVDGSYTAKAYDPITGCLSQTASNAVDMTVTAVKQSADVQVSVYPNPMVSTVKIETGLQEELEYVLYDANGAAVATGSFHAATQLDASTLKAGIYTLAIKNQNKVVASYKLVK